ncbi:hypothetical protein QYM36_015667 [Artemia franciscana]|uniref:Reverse transcriptase/retrotransposon-derived protein RNase H-like domain-containing protein n=1 Tax=Artemia franciscana TaxID=6661 RepID=A0AA88HFC5_ARTSF|nr:hypothetical protein QYM36_015667 [Artemia franciscana]
MYNYTLKRSEVYLSGELQGECTIHLKPGAVPTEHPVSRIPFALHDKLKSELEQLEKQSIIQKVTTPTEWVNSIVTVEKQNGSRRLCLDPRDLNNAIQIPYYPMPTFEDVAAGLHGSELHSIGFMPGSVLRAMKGMKASKALNPDGIPYCILKEVSDELCEPLAILFQISFEQYKFPTSWELSHKTKETFNNLEGLGVIFDDIIVSGKDDSHDRNLVSVLERARKEGVNFNPEKCIFSGPSIRYFGHIITAEGIKPDPRKVQTIKDIPYPTSKEELIMFLGMVNFLSCYVPNLSAINHLLTELEKHATFQWTDVHKSEMEKIKVSICQNLATFDTQSKEVELKIDASKYGLGAELLTHGKIVHFASKALNETEQHNSRIEKELHAFMFGCQKYHQYINGQKKSKLRHHQG